MEKARCIIPRRRLSACRDVRFKVLLIGRNGPKPLLPLISLSDVARPAVSPSCLLLPYVSRIDIDIHARCCCAFTVVTTVANQAHPPTSRQSTLPSVTPRPLHRGHRCSGDPKSILPTTVTKTSSILSSIQPTSLSTLQHIRVPTIVIR